MTRYQGTRGLDELTGGISMRIEGGAHVTAPFSRPGSGIVTRESFTTEPVHLKAD